MGPGREGGLEEPASSLLVRVAVAHPSHSSVFGTVVGSFVVGSWAHLILSQFT